MPDATAIQGMALRYATLSTLLDERMRRRWAAAEARSYGWGGIRAVSRATGLSPNTIAKGLMDLEAHQVKPSAGRAGGGARQAPAASVPPTPIPRGRLPWNDGSIR
jgi:hypothetical protein